MSKADLEVLLPTLSMMAAREVCGALLGVEALLQESQELLARLVEPTTRARLADVGTSTTSVERLLAAMGALQAAHRQWEEQRDRGKPEPLRAKEERARELRRRLVSACRWNLRSVGHVMGALVEMDRDDTTSSVVSELEALSAIVGQRLSAFEDDRTVDALALAEEARSLAETLRASKPSALLDEEQQLAHDLRDRAITYLDGLRATLTEAVRYASGEAARPILRPPTSPTVGPRGALVSSLRMQLARA